MKRAREHDTCRRSIPLPLIRGATGIKRLRGGHHDAPASSSVTLERGRLGNTMVLALLLFSLLGILAAIAGAYALPARSMAARPVKRPPPRHTPTPTAVASSTATATPSPTFTASATTTATVLTNATPSVKATAASTTGNAGGNQRRTPGSTLPTRSTHNAAVQQTHRVQQKGEGTFPPLVLGILSGMAACVLLAVAGLVLLRKWLMPVRRKLPPSGAAPWQRVRDTGLNDNVHSSGYSRQTFPMTDAFLSVTSKNIPSRRAVSSTTTSYFVLKRQSNLPTRHLLRSTRLKAIDQDGMPVAARDSSAILPRQKSQLGATMSEPGREKNSEEMPSLHHPL